MQYLSFSLHQSRRFTQPESLGSTGAVTMGFHSWPPLCFATHHFQDTAAISGPRSSSPNKGNRKFLQVCGNRACYSHPSSNSPTHFSPGNPTQQLSWFCPLYAITIPADWAQDTRCRKHALHQAASGHLRRWTNWPVWGAASFTGGDEHCPGGVAWSLSNHGLPLQGAQLKVGIGCMS